MPTTENRRSTVVCFIAFIGPGPAASDPASVCAAGYSTPRPAVVVHALLLFAVVVQPSLLHVVLLFLLFLFEHLNTVQCLTFGNSSRKVLVMSVLRYAPFGGLQSSFRHILPPRARLVAVIVCRAAASPRDGDCRGLVVGPLLVIQ